MLHCLEIRLDSVLFSIVACSNSQLILQSCTSTNNPMSFVSSFVFDAGNTANSMSFTVQLDHLAQTKLIVLATKQNKVSSSTASVSEEEDVNVQFPREPLTANLYEPLPASLTQTNAL
jgi:hypothetical protein